MDLKKTQDALEALLGEKGETEVDDDLIDAFVTVGVEYTPEEYQTTVECVVSYTAAGTLYMNFFFDDLLEDSEAVHGLIRDINEQYGGWRASLGSRFDDNRGHLRFFRTERDVKENRVCGLVAEALGKFTKPETVAMYEPFKAFVVKREEKPKREGPYDYTAEKAAVRNVLKEYGLPEAKFSESDGDLSVYIRDLPGVGGQSLSAKPHARLTFSGDRGLTCAYIGMENIVRTAENLDLIEYNGLGKRIKVKFFRGAVELSYQIPAPADCAYEDFLRDMIESLRDYPTALFLETLAINSHQTVTKIRNALEKACTQNGVTVQQYATFAGIDGLKICGEDFSLPMNCRVECSEGDNLVYELTFYGKEYVSTPQAAAAAEAVNARFPYFSASKEEYAITLKHTDAEGCKRLDVSAAEFFAALSDPKLGECFAPLYHEVIMRKTAETDRAKGELYRAFSDMGVQPAGEGGTQDEAQLKMKFKLDGIEKEAEASISYGEGRAHFFSVLPVLAPAKKVAQVDEAVEAFNKAGALLSLSVSPFGNKYNLSRYKTDCKEEDVYEFACSTIESLREMTGALSAVCKLIDGTHESERKEFESVLSECGAENVSVKLEGDTYKLRFEYSPKAPYEGVRMTGDCFIIADSLSMFLFKIGGLKSSPEAEETAKQINQSEDSGIYVYTPEGELQIMTRDGFPGSHDEAVAALREAFEALYRPNAVKAIRQMLAIMK